MTAIAQNAAYSSAARRHLAGRLALAILLIAAAILPFWQIHLIDKIWPLDHADLQDVWISVHNILNGRNPYSPEGMRDTQIAYYGHALKPDDKTTARRFLDPVPKDPRGFLYPAHIVMLLGPLGLLPWHEARLAFLLAVLPLLLVGFWAGIKALNLNLSRRKAALAIYLGVCSWPVMWGLRHQQPTVLVVPLTFLAVFFLSRKQPVPAGVLIALATVKPQLSLPILLWMLLWAWSHRVWKFMLVFAIAMAVLLLATELIFPHWLPQWLAFLRHNGANHGGFPIDIILGHQLGFAVTAALGLSVTVLLWRMRKCSADSPEFGLCFALVLSVTVSTCLGMALLIYNQAALFPACVLVLAARPSNLLASAGRAIAFVLILWGYVAVLVSIAGESARGLQSVWLGACFFNPALPVITGLVLACFAGFGIGHFSSTARWHSVEESAEIALSD